LLAVILFTPLFAHGVKLIARIGNARPAVVGMAIATGALEAGLSTAVAALCWQGNTRCLVSQTGVATS
jgi:hypothetical protein